MFASSVLLTIEQESGYYSTPYDYTTFVIKAIGIICIILAVILIRSLTLSDERIDIRRQTRIKDIMDALALLGVFFLLSIGIVAITTPEVLTTITHIQEKIDASVAEAHTKYDRVYDEVMTYASSTHVLAEQECPQRMDASHQYICTQMSQHTAQIMTIEHETSDTTWNDKEALWRERTRELRDKQKILKEDINRYHNLLKEQG